METATYTFQQSKMLFDRAKKHLVGGVNSPVRAYKSVGGNPLFIKKGKGSKIYDVDNNEYVDLVGSYGPLILGHAHQTVVEEVEKSLKQGFSFGATGEKEIELAEVVCNAFPGMDMIRFVNSGTEATMSAIRLARAYTKRNKIIKFAGCYHGHEDNLLVAAGSGVVTLGLPGSEGVPQEVVKDTLVALYNDIESVKKLLEQFEGEVATIIIEPVAGNMGVVKPKDDFLKKLRTLATEHKIVLIVDEVMTGFRSQFGGAQELLGIEADITCLGKVIGGGFPVGAYGGRKEIMEMVAPLGGVYQAGTLSGNPIAMTAGLATLKELKKLDPYSQFKKQTAYLKEQMIEIAEQHNVPIQVNSFGSMINVFFTDQKVVDFETAQTCDTEKFAEFFWSMTDAGIFLPPSQFEAWFLSAVHNDEDIEKIIEAFEKAVRN